MPAIYLSSVFSQELVKKRADISQI